MYQLLMLVLQHADAHCCCVQQLLRPLADAGAEGSDIAPARLVADADAAAGRFLRYVADVR